MGFLQLSSTVQCTCTMGMSPVSLNVLPIPTRVSISGKQAVNMMDHKPMINISSFGMCKSPANPAVISLTAAALGVFTPAPCVPMTQMPIANVNPTVLLENFGAVHKNSKIICNWGGTISAMSPSQLSVTV